MELSSHKTKKLVMLFDIDPQNSPPKKIPMFFSKKIHPEKISYTFSIKSFSYISGNRTL